MAKKNKKAVLEVDESALDRLEEKAKKAKAARQKHAPKTKKEAEEQGLKVVKTVPKNIFDPAKWPSKKDYFMVENELAVKGEDGKTTYKPNGFTRADFPTYKRDSYCYHRICQGLGLPAQENMMAVVSQYGHIWMPLFKSDERDCIEILYYTLDRELIELNDTHTPGQTEQQSDNKHDPGYYKRIRLHPSLVKDGAKYLSPDSKKSHQSYPFIPPQIVELWERREHIETLVITEGEFKAMKACMCGGHVIGIPGIQMSYNTFTQEVYTDIFRIVQDCTVKNIIFLHDGDCIDLSEKSLKSLDGSGQPDQDLAKRPRDFMHSVQNFYRKHKQAFPKVKLYWQYIKSHDLPGNPKGLDDLLVALEKDQARIIEEMEDVNAITAYFHRVNLSSEYQKLSEYFFLNSVKDFYTRHKKEIDPEPEEGKPKRLHKFLWYGTIYCWNDQKKEVEEILSLDLMAYKRIGTSWYKEVKKPTIAKDKNGNIIMTEVLIPWSRQNITDDYGTEILSRLHRYDGFANLPSHEDYKRIVQNFYNLYRPLTYQPSEEDLQNHGFPHILSTIEHIFGKDNRGRGLKPGMDGYDENSQFDIGCDYIQLLYQRPTQNLPILCLVSSERKTGKTTLLDLLQVMFSENAVIVGNDQISSNFNTLVAGRLVVGVDESSLADNKKFTENLKMWSTSKTQSVEGKGKDAYQIPNFTKYILCSNNERRFIYASDEEVRFWVRKVPPFKAGERIGNIIPYFEAEMAAFMAWLNQRALFFAPDDPHEIDRMYFQPEMLHTQWLDELLEAQRPRPEKKMREWLKQWFIDFNKKELLTTADKLQEAIAMTDRKFGTYDLDDLKRYIEENMHVKKFGGGSGKSKRFNFEVVSNFVSSNDKEDSDKVTTQKIIGNGRPYVFEAKAFMSESEYYDLFPEDRPQAKQTEIAYKE